MGGRSCKGENGERSKETKTNFLIMTQSLLKICAYIEGKPTSHRSTLDVCCQPVSDLFGQKVSITGLLAVSGISQESLSLSAGSSVSEKNSTCDRTIEPSRWEGSTLGDLFLSGSNV